MSVSGEKFSGFAFAPESSWKTAGSWVNPRGYKAGLVHAADRAAIEREDAFNTYGDRYAATPGMQTFECSVEFDVHSGTYADLVDLFEGAVGSKEAGGALSFTSSADNFHITHTGTPSSIVRVVDDNGTAQTHYLPVDTNSGGVSALAVGLGTGRVATDIDNPSSLSGGVFKYSLGGAADTFSVEVDWRERPANNTQEVILASGCGITSLQLQFEREKRLAVAVKFKGGHYTESDGPASNISNPSAWTVPFQSWAGDWLLTKSATPKVTDTKTRVKKFTCELAAPLLEERGAVGLDGGSTASSVLSGSDLTGFTREPAGQESIVMVVPFDRTYVTDYKAGTAYLLWAVLYPGVPAAASLPANRIILFFRRLVMNRRPKVVMDGGYRCHELSFQIERDTTANSVQERYSVGFVNA